MSLTVLNKLDLNKHFVLERCLDNYDSVYLRFPMPNGTTNTEIQIDRGVAYQMRLQAEFNGGSLVGYAHRSKSRIERYIELAIEEREA